MNISVARKLHERRFRASPVVTTGELITLIGSDGMQEALQNRWVVPDMDSGFLMLNPNGGKMVELESACRCDCGKTDCACTAPAVEPLLQTMPMRENFAAFGVTRPGITNNVPDAAPAPAQPAQPQTPTSHVAPTKAPPRVGDPAMVEHGGQTYTGEVSGVEPDGRVRLRWSGPRPPEDRAYGPNEFLVTNNATHA